MRTEHFRVIAVSVAILYCLSLDIARAESVAKAERGITGTFAFQYEGPSLRAKSLRDADTPLIVRIQRNESPSQYSVRFIGNVPGQFDLRDWLEHTDGSPLQSAQPMVVTIVSTLPNDPRSDLFEVDGFQPGFRGGYRLALVLIGMAWLGVPIVVIASRILTRPKAIQTKSVVTELSLADQLRPLVETAAQGQLSTNDKARLELLLLRYWRQEANLPYADMAVAITKLRTHSQAGPILAAVERWLHAENGVARPESVQDVLRLLEPFRSVPAQPADAPAVGSSAS